MRQRRWPNAWRIETERGVGARELVKTISRRWKAGEAEHANNAGHAHAAARAQQTMLVRQMLPEIERQALPDLVDRICGKTGVHFSENSEARQLCALFARRSPLIARPPRTGVVFATTQQNPVSPTGLIEGRNHASFFSRRAESVFSGPMVACEVPVLPRMSSAAERRL